jgi:hypothetical protein
MGLITKGMGAMLKTKVPKKKILSLGKNQTELKKLEFKINKAPPKARIETSGHGKMGETVEPKKDLIEDYEILRDKISRGKK